MIMQHPIGGEWRLLRNDMLIYHVFNQCIHSQCKDKGNPNVQK